MIEVCNAIYDCLEDEYLKIPQTKENWKRIAEKTQERWQFPNCMGAADEKHKSILRPKDYGPDFCNYKGFFSIAMPVIVDCDYKFLFLDVGCRGRISDGGVFRNSAFNKASQRDKLNLLDPAPLPTSIDPTWLHEQNDPLPYVFVADDAFPLHFLKPYPQKNLSDMKRIFNYKISRRRRISENVFGIWGQPISCVYNCNGVFTGKSCHHNTCNHAANERTTAL